MLDIIYEVRFGYECEFRMVMIFFGVMLKGLKMLNILLMLEVVGGSLEFVLLVLEELVFFLLRGICMLGLLLKVIVFCFVIVIMFV